MLKFYGTCTCFYAVQQSQSVLRVQGTDAAVEGVWAFPNGTEFPVLPFFGAGEPSGGIAENCLAVFAGADGLVDVPCDFTFGLALCEADGKLLIYNIALFLSEKIP